MVNMEPIERIIELALYTAYIRKEIPLSLLVLSDVEQGKSAMVMQFQQDDGSVVTLHDATAFGILREYKDRLLAGKVKHFIFPEFVFPLSRTKETVHTFLAFLNGLMEEGIKEIQTFATPIRLPRPINAGVIACLAKDEFNWRKYYWSSIGFLSRFLPVSYSYSTNTVNAILETIYCDKKTNLQHLYNFTEAEVRMSPNFARRINVEAKRILDDMAEPATREHGEIKKLVGLRMQKHLQKLMKAAALSKGRQDVEEEDLQEVARLCKYINLEYNEL